jgi:prepilin-type N-terminal cleavage/methylation domain-containing protein
MDRSLRGQAGFTLIEILISMTLMAVGVAATLGVFGASGRTALVAQRSDIAVQQAQAEVDRLSRMSYDKLGLTSTPATSSDPRNPGSRVTGSTLLIKSGLSETFVLSSDAGQSAAAVAPGPETFAVGVGDATVAGKIYRYVTWRDVDCTSGCTGTKDTKRITVAVTIDASPNAPTLNPIWTSTVIPDPAAIAPGTNAPVAGGGASTVSAQNFYLYDTRCGNSSRQAQTGDHTTHSTASAGSQSSYYSICENANFSGALQPDLMGNEEPPGNSSTPLYTYSSDLNGAYDGGLVMKRQGTACRTSYQILDTFDSTKPNAWSVHAWSTVPFLSTFDVDGLVTLSLFTETLGGLSGRGYVCATLLDRTVSNSVPVDTVIGSTGYDLASWPTDLRRLTFSFKVTNTDIASGHRLVLALNVRSESANDLVFRYDHPLYPSMLQLATSTPL